MADIEKGKAELPAALETLKESVAVNFEGIDVGSIKLPSVKVLHAGACLFELPATAEGVIAHPKEISAVILYKQRVRAYWGQKFSGTRQLPDCSSVDGITGFPKDSNNKISCKECPKSVWGSAEDSARAQACKDMRRLFLQVPPGQVVPVILVVPPTSIKNTDMFFFKLVNRRPPLLYTEIMVKLLLSEEKNKDGISFSKLDILMDRELTPEEKIMAQFSAQFFQIRESHARRRVDTADFDARSEAESGSGEEDGVPF
jgi:hypothetical protein